MSIGQVNDENASVRGLIIAMVTMEQSSLVRAFFGPKILEVFADHMLPMTSVVERDLFTHPTNESNRAVCSTVFAMRWGPSSSSAVGRRGRCRQELLHADLIIDEMLLLHRQRLRLQKGRTSACQHFVIDLFDLNGNKDVQGNAIAGKFFFELLVLASQMEEEVVTILGLILTIAHMTTKHVCVLGHLI